jgi:hypothetical protein
MALSGSCGLWTLEPGGAEMLPPALAARCCPQSQPHREARLSSGPSWLHCPSPLHLQHGQAGLRQQPPELTTALSSGWWCSVLSQRQKNCQSATSPQAAWPGPQGDRVAVPSQQAQPGPSDGRKKRLEMRWGVHTGPRDPSYLHPLPPPPREHTKKLGKYRKILKKW